MSTTPMFEVVAEMSYDPTSDELHVFKNGGVLLLDELMTDADPLAFDDDVCDVCLKRPATTWLGDDVHACQTCSGRVSGYQAALEPHVAETARRRAAQEDEA